MYFPIIDAEVLYIIVSTKIHIGNDMDKGHYICYVLYHSKVTWWNCDDTKITQYSGYPMNIYNNLSIDNEQKKGNVVIDGSYRIMSMLYIKKYILASSTYSFITGKSVSKEMEILRRE